MAAPQIQIFPMTNGYLDGTPIGTFFTNDLFVVSAHRPTAGRFNFKSQGVTAPSGSLLLFQFAGHIVAHASLLGCSKRDASSPADSKGFLLLSQVDFRYYTTQITQHQARVFWPHVIFGSRKWKLDSTQRGAFLSFAGPR